MINETAPTNTHHAAEDAARLAAWNTGDTFLFMILVETNHNRNMTAWVNHDNFHSDEAPTLPAVIDERSTQYGCSHR